jgi:hypothetical protein
MVPVDEHDSRRARMREQPSHGYLPGAFVAVVGIAATCALMLLASSSISSPAITAS